MKKYKVGFYGGKFMPFHKGHEYCLRVAAEQCEKVYAIMFIGGDDELDILKNMNEEYLTVESRYKQLKHICKMLESESHVVPVIIDVTNVKLEDGSEDWDGETPLVRKIVGNKIGAVYSSEPKYGEYFKRAYPESEHILVDPPRITFPISGTKIRNMNDEGEKRKWMV